MKILGLRKIEEKDYTIFKNDWLEFATGFHKLNFKIAPASYFDNRARISFSLGWGQFFISIPFIRSKYDECDPPRYGFYLYSEGRWFPDNFVWCWGRKTKFFHMPWDYTWVRTSVLRKDGEWEHEDIAEKLGERNKQFCDEEKWKGVFWEETHPYFYVLKDGNVQTRTATIKVEEREWRPRWFKWTKMFAMVRRTIDVRFSDEVGERTGSWKGGTLGCGYELLPGETPLQCLRRIESERKF
jgi:hypothetical protein